MVQIVEVKTKKQIKQFVEFPNKLYKGNPYYCPPMAGDEVNTFTIGKNPAYDFCESREFLAYKDGKIVGRIAGIISQAHIDRHKKMQIRFGRFDAIDDIEVSKALFKAVRDYGKEKGMDEIIGPLGFTDTDREGMLIEGFEEKNLSITIYNHPYYKDHMEQLGFKKDVDWVEGKGTNSYGAEVVAVSKNSTAFFEGNQTWQRDILGIMTHANYGSVADEADVAGNRVSEIFKGTIAIMKAARVKEDVVRNLTYTLDEEFLKEEYEVPMNDYFKAEMDKFIIGTTDVNSDSAWNAYLKQINDMSLDKVLKVKQGAYDRAYGK
jgi:hypothetical protein